MKTAVRLGVLMLTFWPGLPAFAEDKTLENRLKQVEEELRQYRSTLKQYQEHERREGTSDQRDGVSNMSDEQGIGSLPEVGKDFRRQTQAPLSFGSSGSGRLIYAKPFVAAPKAIVGGYMDIQYRAQRKGSLENGYGGNTNGFDQQRFVPFIYADITEHVKFASEIEIEHGIRETSDNEISLEFAHVDYLVHEPFNIRAGILLLPVGKFNLLHDSPLNDLTDRPLVSQFLIPTTMAETGAGFYGTFYPGATSKLDYELYVTTGPCGYNNNGDPRINEANGTKNSRQRKCASDDGLDINNGKAVSGRLAFSPMLGVEVAGSGYHGNSAPGPNYNPLTIAAVDWTLQRGPFELIGEAAWAYARNNSRAINCAGRDTSSGTACAGAFSPGSILTGLGGNAGLGIPPQRMNGFYIQGNYHFMPDFLRAWSPKRFGEGSIFTAVIRYDRVNTNLDNKTGGYGDLEQISFGLNYRPIEDTVFKVSYQYQPKSFNPNNDTRIHDSAFVFSVATYF